MQIRIFHHVLRTRCNPAVTIMTRARFLSYAVVGFWFGESSVFTSCPFLLTHVNVRCDSQLGIRIIIVTSFLNNILYMYLTPVYC